MFAKASTLLAVLALAARVAAAAPPACLLAAVNTCENPADIKNICSNESDKVTSYITKNCGDYEDAATKWFKETCEDAGETISGGSSNSSSSSSTASSSGSKTSSASVLSTAGTAGPTTTGNAGTSPTSAAGSASSGSPSEGGATRVGMEFATLAAIGVVGAMLAL
jgi:cobalamin biosynthesis Mg chelatase CobN